MANMKARYIFDALLTAMLVFEMFFQLTGDLLHEIVGAVFFATIIAHLALSWKWVRVTASKIADRSSGGLTGANKVRLAIAVLLAVCMLALIASSVAISNVLNDLTGANLAGSMYAEWSIVHTVSSYALCAIVAMHLAVHWSSVAATFRIPYSRERREVIGSSVKAVAALGALALCATGFDKANSAVAQMAESDALRTSSPDGGETPQSPKTYMPDTGGRAKGHAGRRQDGSGKGFGMSDAGGAVGASSSQSDSGRNTDGGTDAGGGNAANSTGEELVAQGICPLCPDKCPLSAPRCGRPHRAGLV